MEAKNQRFKLLIPLIAIVFLLVVAWTLLKQAACFSGSRILASHLNQNQYDNLNNDNTSSPAKKHNRPIPQRRQSPFAEFTKFPEIRILSGGLITNEGARQLNLTDDERKLSNEAIKKSFSDMQAALSGTVQLTKQEGYTTKFFIPAIGNRANRAIETLQNDLASILGEARALQLMNTMPIQEYFGGYGQYDVSIEVISRDSISESNRSLHKSDTARINYYDPSNGRRIYRGSMRWEFADELFPGLFEMAPSN